MSQLARAVRAVETTDRKILDSFTPLFRDLVEVSTHVSENPYNVGKVYEIGVKIGSRVTIPDHPNNLGPDAVWDAVESTKQSIIEAIFGEFRADIRLIETAVYLRDIDQARTLLAQLERKMFSTE